MLWLPDENDGVTSEDMGGNHDAWVRYMIARGVTPGPVIAGHLDFNAGLWIGVDADPYLMQFPSGAHDIYFLRDWVSIYDYSHPASGGAALDIHGQETWGWLVVGEVVLVSDANGSRYSTYSYEPSAFSDLDFPDTEAQALVPSGSGPLYVGAPDPHGNHNANISNTFQRVTINAQYGTKTFYDNEGKLVRTETRSGLFTVTAVGEPEDQNPFNTTDDPIQTGSGRYIISLGQYLGVRDRIWGQGWFDRLEILPIDLWVERARLGDVTQVSLPDLARAQTGKTLTQLGFDLATARVSSPLLQYKDGTYSVRPVYSPSTANEPAGVFYFHPELTGRPLPEKDGQPQNVKRTDPGLQEGTLSFVDGDGTQLTVRFTVVDDYSKIGINAVDPSNITAHSRMQSEQRLSYFGYTDAANNPLVVDGYGFDLVHAQMLFGSIASGASKLVIGTGNDFARFINANNAPRWTEMSGTLQPGRPFTVKDGNAQPERWGTDWAVDWLWAASLAAENITPPFAGEVMNGMAGASGGVVINPANNRPFHTATHRTGLSIDIDSPGLETSPSTYGQRFFKEVRYIKGTEFLPPEAGGGTLYRPAFWVLAANEDGTKIWVRNDSGGYSEQSVFGLYDAKDLFITSTGTLSLSQLKEWEDYLQDNREVGYDHDRVISAIKSYLAVRTNGVSIERIYFNDPRVFNDPTVSNYKDNVGNPIVKYMSSHDGHIHVELNPPPASRSAAIASAGAASVIDPDAAQTAGAIAFAESLASAPLSAALAVSDSESTPPEIAAGIPTAGRVDANGAQAHFSLQIGSINPDLADLVGNESARYFTLQRGLTLALLGASADLDIALGVDVSRDGILQDSEIEMLARGSALDRETLISPVGLEELQYLVRVWAKDGKSASDFTLSFDPAPPAERIDAAGETAATARALALTAAPTDISDGLSPADRVDLYRLAVGGASVLNLAFTGMSGGNFLASVVWHGSNPAQPGRLVDSIVAEPDTAAGLTAYLTEPGNYTLQLDQLSGSTPYTLRAALQALADIPDRGGANLNGATNLGSITEPTRVGDTFLSPTDLADVYRVNLSEGGAWQVVLVTLEGNAELSVVRDANQNFLVDPGEVVVTTDLENENTVETLSLGTSAGELYLWVQGALPTRYEWFLTNRPDAIDRTAPSLMAMSPPSASTGVPATAPVRLEFSEPVRAGSGSVVLVSTDGVVGEYSITDSPSVSIRDSVLTIDPPFDLAPGTTYTLTLPAGAIRDMSGNPHAGTAGYSFTTSLTGRSEQAIAGTAVADVLVGTTGGDTLLGLAGDDRLTGFAGNDSLDGGDGLDSAVFYSPRAQNTLTQRSGGVIEVVGSEGTDTLVNVERLAFADLSLGFDVEGTGGKAFRLYKAAYDREPDPVGLGFWLYHLDRGFDMVAAADNFLNQLEFRSLYDVDSTMPGYQEPSNEQYCHLVYQHVLQRAPDPSGYQFWADAMSNKGGIYGHAWTRGEVLILFAESAENYQNTAALIGAGFEYAAFAPPA